MAPEEKLDFILRHYTTIAGRALSETALVNKFGGKEIRDGAELNQIVQKLFREGYLADGGVLSEKFELEETESTFYCLTFDGEVFIENGGYVQRKQDKIKADYAIETRNKRMERNDERLVLWTATLAIGSIGLLLCEALKIYWCRL